MPMRLRRLLSRGSRNRTQGAEEAGKTPDQILEEVDQKTGVNLALEQVYEGKLTAPYTEVYSYFQEDPDNVGLIINQYLHQEDRLFVYDRLMIGLVEDMLEKEPDFTDVVRMYSCMWSILVERWQLCQHDTEQWKQNAFRLKNCIQQAELNHKKSNAEGMNSMYNSKLTVNLSELDATLEEIYVERKEAIPREQLSRGENVAILRQLQTDAIQQYLHKLALEKLGNLVYVYEKKLSVEHEQWQLTYLYSETQKLLSKVTEWYSQTKVELLDRNLAVDLLLADFKNGITSFIDDNVSASGVLEEIPEEVTELAKQFSEEILEEFKERQADNIQKLLSELESWFGTNQARFIREHLSLDSAIDAFSEEVLLFIARRYPNVDMLDVAPRDVISQVQQYENQLWDGYQSHIMQLKKRFREWFQSQDGKYVRAGGVNWEAFDVDVQRWFESSVSQEPPEDLNEYINDFRDNLRSAFYERHAERIDSLKADYISWAELNRERFLKFFFEMQAMLEAFRSESKLFFASAAESFDDVPQNLVVEMLAQTDILQRAFEANSHDKMESWEQLLSAMSMEEFACEFAEEGFDDPRLWPQVGDELLASMGFRQGHILKWRRIYVQRTKVWREFSSINTNSPSLSALATPPAVPLIRLSSAEKRSGHI